MTKRLTQSELDKRVLALLEGTTEQQKQTPLKSLLDMARRKRGEAEKAPPEEPLQTLEGR